MKCVTTLLEILNEEQTRIQSFETLCNKSHHCFKKEDKMKVGKAIVFLLHNPDMLRSDTQRLAAVILLHDLYRRDPIETVPFLQLFINIILRQEYMARNQICRQDLIDQSNSEPSKLSESDKKVIYDWEYDYIVYTRIPEFSVTACNFLSQLLTHNPKELLKKTALYVLNSDENIFPRADITDLLNVVIERDYDASEITSGIPVVNNIPEFGSGHFSVKQIYNDLRWYVPELYRPVPSLLDEYDDVVLMDANKSKLNQFFYLYEKEIQKKPYGLGDSTRVDIDYVPIQLDSIFKLVSESVTKPTTSQFDVMCGNVVTNVSNTVGNSCTNDEARNISNVNHNFIPCINVDYFGNSIRNSPVSDGICLTAGMNFASGVTNDDSAIIGDANDSNTRNVNSMSDDDLNSTVQDTTFNFDQDTVVGLGSFDEYGNYNINASDTDLNDVAVDNFAVSSHTTNLTNSGNVSFPTHYGGDCDVNNFANIGFNDRFNIDLPTSTIGLGDINVDTLSASSTINNTTGLFFEPNFTTTGRNNFDSGVSSGFSFADRNNYNAASIFPSNAPFLGQSGYNNIGALSNNDNFATRNNYNVGIHPNLTFTEQNNYISVTSTIAASITNTIATSSGFINRDMFNVGINASFASQQRTYNNVGITSNTGFVGYDKCRISGTSSFIANYNVGNSSTDKLNDYFISSASSLPYNNYYPSTTASVSYNNYFDNIGYNANISTANISTGYINNNYFANIGPNVSIAYNNYSNNNNNNNNNNNYNNNRIIPEIPDLTIKPPIRPSYNTVGHNTIRNSYNGVNSASYNVYTYGSTTTVNTVSRNNNYVSNVGFNNAANFTINTVVPNANINVSTNSNIFHDSAVPTTNVGSNLSSINIRNEYIAGSMFNMRSNNFYSIFGNTNAVTHTVNVVSSSRTNCSTEDTLSSSRFNFPFNNTLFTVPPPPMPQIRTNTSIVTTHNSNNNNNNNNNNNVPQFTSILTTTNTVRTSSTIMKTVPTIKANTSYGVTVASSATSVTATSVIFVDAIKANYATGNNVINPIVSNVPTYINTTITNSPTSLTFTTISAAKPLTAVNTRTVQSIKIMTTTVHTTAHSKNVSTVPSPSITSSTNTTTVETTDNVPSVKTSFVNHVRKENSNSVVVKTTTATTIANTIATTNTNTIANITTNTIATTVTVATTTIAIASTTITPIASITISGTIASTITTDIIAGTTTNAITSTTTTIATTTTTTTITREKDTAKINVNLPMVNKSDSNDSTIANTAASNNIVSANDSLNDTKTMNTIAQNFASMSTSDDVDHTIVTCTSNSDGIQSPVTSSTTTPSSSNLKTISTVIAILTTNTITTSSKTLINSSSKSSTLSGSSNALSHPVAILKSPARNLNTESQTAVTTVASSTENARSLIEIAHVRILSQTQQEELYNMIEKDENLLRRIGLSPERFPHIVEHNPMVAIEALVRMIDWDNISDYFNVLVNMDMSLHSMEVVNRLSNMVELPKDFILAYICHCFVACSKVSDQYLKCRLVRLVCVFLQSLIRNKIIDAQDIQENAITFCVQFIYVREAASLYKLLKNIEQSMRPGTRNLGNDHQDKRSSR